jgi:hypothetical protein
MRQFIWLIVQVAIIAGTVYVFSDIASEKGTELHMGQAMMVGVILAFLVTLTWNILAGLLLVVRKALGRKFQSRNDARPRTRHTAY